MPLAPLLLAAAIPPAHVWTSRHEGAGRCRPLRDATRARLWIIYPERDRVVEQADPSSPVGGIAPNGASKIAGMEMSADPPRRAPCWRLAWRAEPWGARPADAADFGGRWPAGLVDIYESGDDDEWNGAIQIVLPDDRVREAPETFRIVLLDPVTRRPLAGRIGRRAEGGARDRHAPAAALDMRGRLVFTIEDSPAPMARPARLR